MNETETYKSKYYGLLCLTPEQWTPYYFDKTTWQLKLLLYEKNGGSIPFVRTK